MCGSGAWDKPDAIDISPLLRNAVDAGVTVGVICAGTLTAARAGLFATRKHTSNSREWIAKAAQGYAGAAHYQDGNAAVSDQGVISAPASAPASFAIKVLEAVFPQHPALGPTRQMLSTAN